MHEQNELGLTPQDEFQSQSNSDMKLKNRKTSSIILILSILRTYRIHLGLIWGVVFLAATLIAFMLPKKYTSQATFQVNSSGSMKLSIPEGLKMLDPKFNSGGSGTGAVLAILESRIMAVDIINAYDLKKKYKTKWENLAIKEFHKNFGYEALDENIISVSFTYSSQDSVKIILDSIISYLNLASIKFSTSKASLEYNFNRAIVDSVYHHLDSLSTVWIDFMNRNKMANFEKNIELSLSTFGQIEEELIRFENEFVISKIDNNKSPQDRQNISTMIGQLKKKRRDILAGHLLSDKKANEIEIGINYDSIPKMTAFLEKLALLVDKDKIILRALLPKLEDSHIKMIETTPVLNIIDPTFIPPYKSGPKRSMIIILTTVFVGTLLTAFLIIWKIFSNPKFRSSAISEILRDVRSFE